MPPPALAKASGQRRMDPSSAQLRDLEWRRYIRRRRGQDGDHAPEDLTGIALSGGGIRSATFALGVLQALARHDLLSRFDYLSTVSGGGYIGTSLTWLTSKPSPTGRARAAQGAAGDGGAASSRRRVSGSGPSARRRRAPRRRSPTAATIRCTAREPRPARVPKARCCATSASTATI